MDDIAWLSLRATQEPFPRPPDPAARVRGLSGNYIDEARVRYYQVMAETKLQVMGHRGPDDGRTMRGDWTSGGGGGDVGNGFIYQVLHRRLWFEALGGGHRLELDARRNPPGSGTRGTATGCTAPYSHNSGIDRAAGVGPAGRRRAARASHGSSSI